MSQPPNVPPSPPRPEQVPEWQQQSGAGPQAPAGPRNGLALAGLIVGILSLIFLWVPFLGPLGALVGLVLALVGLRKVGSGAAGGKGLAIGGLVTSGVALLAGAAVTIGVLAAIGQASDAIDEQNQAQAEHDSTAEEVVASQAEQEATQAAEQAADEAAAEEAAAEEAAAQEAAAEAEEEAAQEKAAEEAAEKAAAEEEARGTVAQQNALRSAESYLDYTAFSRSGLIGQLEYEGFSTQDATWGVDQVTVDWDEQAALSAENYLEYTAFSRSGLVDQLIFEGFTPAQAEYGVSQTGL